jgi:hypothetical protein
MIRRPLSIILFVLGGWMVMTEVILAFIDVDPGFSDNLMMIAVCAVLVLPLLLLGAWASPGRRWRELGLTVLVSAGVAAVCGLMTFIVINDPTAIQLFPQPMPHIAFAPAVGTVNLLLIGAIGWLLHRGRTGETNAVIE